MDELKIEIRFEKENNGSFAYDGDKRIGECEFIVKDGNWVIVHTGVNEAYGGRGIAKKLVLSVITNARQNNVKITPICSYAKKVMESSEFKDVLA